MPPASGSRRRSAGTGNWGIASRDWDQREGTFGYLKGPLVEKFDLVPLNSGFSVPSCPLEHYHMFWSFTIREFG